MVSLDSVETRRRLLKSLPNVIIIAMIAAASWRFFVHPLLKRTFAVAAPPLTTTMLGGKPFSIAAERGHMVVLDFFATWCDPCRQSLPYILRFESGHPDVTVVLVDEGEPERIVAPFVALHHLKNTIIDENFAIGRAYNVNGFPVTVVVDGQGLIRNTFWGFSPQIGDYLLAAKLRYEARPRARNEASPARPS